MICVKFTAFCDLRAVLRIHLATLRKSARKFWFCKLALIYVDLRVRLASGLTRITRYTPCPLFEHRHKPTLGVGESSSLPTTFTSRAL